MASHLTNCAAWAPKRTATIFHALARLLANRIFVTNVSARVTHGNQHVEKERHMKHHAKKVKDVKYGRNVTLRVVCVGLVWIGVRIGRIKNKRLNYGQDVVAYNVSSANVGYNATSRGCQGGAGRFTEPRKSHALHDLPKCAF